MSKAAELASLIGNINAGGGGVNRNVIINGAMNVAQRNTSKASITAESYNTVDRFLTAISSAGTWTQSQVSVTDLAGFQNALKMDCTTADASLSASDYCGIQQRFEGQNLVSFKKGLSDAKPFTLSFYVKSNKTGTYTVELYDTDNTRQVSQSYTISSANTWEQKSLTFPADTTGAFVDDANFSMMCEWYLASGSNYKSGTLNTSWNSVTAANRVASGQVNLADSTDNEWFLTGVQLEVGQNPTEFEHEPFGRTYEKCERYYQKSYIHSEAPGGSTNAGTGTYLGGVIGMSNYNTQYNQLFYDYPQFRTHMRAAPTAVVYNIYSGAAAGIQHYNSGDNHGVSYAHQSENGFRIYSNSLNAYGNNNGGDYYAFHYTADAEL